MSAYVILIKHHTLKPDELDTYASLAKLARAGHNPKPIAYYGEIEVLEGQPEESVAVLEFPDMAAARNWYESPAYQKAKPHRNAGADYSVLLVNGVASAAISHEQEASKP
ncbi:DUF1330 domain-containing protein [Uliginosibacterium sp. TH139]|uniref:DUF1330 domain-containing protein n=1 Tax=Uliginosibacterium sp. TH139 TaxID=2067453 RepID=UPI000C79888D|nr:DUF1330 domain-containing protein [Uliginosibacterium sp. TH139]PLK46986.1 DUF1330 domain-containing protein [Uliginosibacterium sp. TH139]